MDSPNAGSEEQEEEDRREKARQQLSRATDEMEVRFRLAALLALAAVTCFECLHLRLAEVDLSEQAVVGIRDPSRQGGRFFDLQGLWLLARPYWLEAGLRPWLHLALCVASELCSLWVQKESASFIASYWNSIQYKDLDAFISLLESAAYLFLVAILNGAYSAYVQSMLQIHWRSAMTKKLVRLWLGDKAYYRMRLSPGREDVDNPDQRLQQDVSSFVGSSMLFFFGLLDAVGKLLIFLPMLWALTPEHAFGVEEWRVPGWLFWICLAYAGCGSAAMYFIGRPLILIDYATQRYEADFRSGLIRVREEAEGVALFGAEANEEAALGSAFRRVRRIIWAAMRTNLRINMYKSFYYFTSDLFPLFVLSPSYFSGKITLGGAESDPGGISPGPRGSLLVRECLPGPHGSPGHFEPAPGFRSRRGPGNSRHHCRGLLPEYVNPDSTRKHSRCTAAVWGLVSRTGGRGAGLAPAACGRGQGHDSDVGEIGGAFLVLNGGRRNRTARGAIAPPCSRCTLSLT